MAYIKSKCFHRSKASTAKILFCETFIWNILAFLLKTLLNDIIFVKDWKLLVAVISVFHYCMMMK